jgi:hypothetical protein
MHNTMHATMPALFHPSPPSASTSRRPDVGSPGAPHSVWLAPPRAIKTPVALECELPVWAFEAACSEYAARGGAVAVMNGPTAAFDASLAPTSLAPTWLHAAEELDLPTHDAEPAALAVVLDEPPAYPDLIERDRNGWHRERTWRFYRALRASLAPGGIALIHTHTAPTAHGLFDPAATTLREAEGAGLRYLQRIVIVHTRLDAPTTSRYRPPAQQPAPPACRRVHSDLYVLRKPEGASR